MSVIDELAARAQAHQDRTPLRFSSRNAVFGFMEEEIEKGRQVYVVYPLIEESDPEKAGHELKDLTDGYESLSRRFPLPKYAVSIVHGRMTAGGEGLRDGALSRKAKRTCWWPPR
jgi:ATP-dependent DNA helicase RecG